MSNTRVAHGQKRQVPLRRDDRAATTRVPSAHPRSPTWFASGTIFWAKRLTRSLNVALNSRICGEVVVWWYVV